MTKPYLGEISECVMCHMRIQYMGDYWKHMDTQPCHPARAPLNVYKEGDKDGEISYLRVQCDRLRAENDALKAQLHKFMDEYGGAMMEREELKNAMQWIADNGPNGLEKFDYFWYSEQAQLRANTALYPPPAAGESDGEGETK